MANKLPDPIFLPPFSKPFDPQFRILQRYNPYNPEKLGLNKGAIMAQPLTPINASDRVPVIDALRGFAVLGILFMNVKASLLL